MKSNKTKRAFPKKKIIFGAMFIISLIILMLTISFSWFFNGTFAKVSEITIEAEEANNLLLKTGEGDEWVKTIYLPFPADFDVKPVTGDGVHFYEAILEKTDENRDFTVQQYKEITSTDFAAKGIYEYSFSMKVENTLPLYLSKTSSVLPKEPDVHDSAYGDYSAGYICAAMRVAILEKVGDNYETRLIWIPNATTRLITTGNTDLIVEGTGSDVESQYVFITDVEQDHKTVISTNGRTSGVQQLGPVLYAWGDLPENLQFSALTAETQSDFKLVIWLDGNDRECHNALMDGMIDVHLDFTVNNETEDTEQS